ncbi:uncharacterized protein LOC132057724 [Lycium ferocissimum]|uniref:uncharacterized protein LOC132057724 n=1 Tax=Lycium ferocissimum TaxID=112874 RepID=UPI002815A0EE|nr:uncharacterized protein LOC132057724 [Lycium ferocissimum]
MAAPPNMEEGQSFTRPPRFNGKYYGWWKTRMHDFIMAEDSELWDVICDGPYIPVHTSEDGKENIVKMRKEYNEADRKRVDKNYKANKILVCGIGPDEYNRASACSLAKKIWEALQTTHEGTTQVKNFKIDMLTTEYKMFKMKESESIHEMHTRFTSIINELHSLGEVITTTKLTAKRNQVPDRSFRRKETADEIVKQVVAAWEDSSNESEDENDKRELSILAIDDGATEYKSDLSLTAESDTDDDDNDDENKKVNFFDIKKNLRLFSQRKFISLSGVLIDVYHGLVIETQELNLSLDEIELDREDLCVLAKDMKNQVYETNQQNILLESQVRKDEEISFKKKKRSKTF